MKASGNRNSNAIRSILSWVQFYSKTTTTKNIEVNTNFKCTLQHFTAIYQTNLNNRIFRAENFEVVFFFRLLQMGNKCSEQEIEQIKLQTIDRGKHIHKRNGTAFVVSFYSYFRGFFSSCLRWFWLCLPRGGLDGRPMRGANICFYFLSLECLWTCRFQMAIWVKNRVVIQIIIIFTLIKNEKWNGNIKMQTIYLSAISHFSRIFINKNKQTQRSIAFSFSIS